MNIIDNIINHLELLGYKVEKNKNEKGKIYAYAEQDDDNLIFITETSSNFILFSVSFHTEKQPTLEMNTFSNRINKMLLLSKIYLDKTKDNNVKLVFEAVYTGDYIKENFGKFYNLFKNELNKVSSDEETAILFT